MTTSIETTEIIPQFTLQDETGKEHSLPDLMGANGLLLVFVQGTWCPPCVTTLYFLSKHAGEFQKQGVHVAVIAMDDARTLNTFKASASIPLSFPLLADPDNAVREQFGVMMIETYMVIDREYRLRARFLDEDGHSRPGVNALMAAVRLHLAD